MTRQSMRGARSFAADAWSSSALFSYPLPLGGPKDGRAPKRAQRRVPGAVSSHLRLRVDIPFRTLLRQLSHNCCIGTAISDAVNFGVLYGAQHVLQSVSSLGLTIDEAMASTICVLVPSKNLRRFRCGNAACYAAPILNIKRSGHIFRIGLGHLLCAPILGRFTLPLTRRGLRRATLSHKGRGKYAQA